MTWALRARTGPWPNKENIVTVIITRKGCLGDEIGIMIGECDLKMVLKIRVSFGMEKKTETSKPNQNSTFFLN